MIPAAGDALSGARSSKGCKNEGNLTFYLAMLETPEQKSKFEDIYTNYRGLMLYTAYQVMHDYQLAEDIVHEVFVKIIKKIDYVHSEDCNQLKSFLVTSTKNQAIDFLRKGKREQAEDEPAARLEQEGSYAESTEKIVASRDNIQRILAVVEKLNESYRRPLTLWVQGYSTQDIAALLDLSVGNVKVRLYRGREQARRLFEQEGNHLE